MLYNKNRNVNPNFFVHYLIRLINWVMLTESLIVFDHNLLTQNSRDVITTAYNK